MFVQLRVVPGGMPDLLICFLKVKEMVDCLGNI